MTIGKRIQALRYQAGMSQRELADKIDMNYSVMNRVESDKRSLRDEELIKIAEALEVSTDYLLGRTDNTNVIICDTDAKTEGLVNEIVALLVELGAITEDEAENGITDLEKKKEIMKTIEVAVEVSRKMKN